MVVTFAGVDVARTRRALKVLETGHPPTWYLTPDDVRRELLRPAEGSSFCEWKGAAAYVDLVVGDRVAERAGWYYPEPAEPYGVLAGHVAFYAGRVDRASVDDEAVRPQPGGFYGGWITADVAGPFNSAPGSEGW